MESNTSMKTMKNRLKSIEPELVDSILKCVQMAGFTDRELRRLVHMPDRVLHILVNDAKKILASKSYHQSEAFSSVRWFLQLYDSTMMPPRPYGRRTLEDPHVPSTYGHEYLTALRQQSAAPLMDFVTEGYGIPDQFQSETLDDFRPKLHDLIHDDFYDRSDFGGFSLWNGRREESCLGTRVNTCFFYSQGCCKHGSSCRFSHTQSMDHNYLSSEDNGPLPDSLVMLEKEIVDLLKAHGGHGISIASLPYLYLEMYGKNLQAEGYLTESQRHGKAGYSLTRLLARLKNSIRITARPHGQHFVTLVPRSRHERNSGRRNVATGSQQIYLTFPASSKFTEQDVMDHFNQFGTVQSVRIPSQERRMYGFVTFESPATVRRLLTMPFEHYICGARVLVKTYQENARKNSEKADIPFMYSSTAPPMGYYSSRQDETQKRFETLSKEFENFVAMHRSLEEHFNSLQLAPRQPALREVIPYLDIVPAEGSVEHNSPDAGKFLSQHASPPNHYTGSVDDSSSSRDSDTHLKRSDINLPENPFDHHK